VVIINEKSKYFGAKKKLAAKKTARQPIETICSCALQLSHATRVRSKISRKLQAALCFCFSFYDLSPIQGCNIINKNYGQY
jgi:hypothetical protein